MKNQRLKYAWITISIILHLVNNICPFAGQLYAQESPVKFSPTLKWTGFTNIWSGYAQRDSLDAYYGLNVRHLRIKASGKLAPQVKYTVQFAFDRGNPALLDVHLSYEHNDFFKVRFGQFGVPGAKTGALSSPMWSTTKMVFNDRSTITQNWMSNTGLKGYRAGGIMIYGQILKRKLHYFFMGAFPNTGPNYYWNSSVKNPSYEDNENRRALFTRLEYRPIDEIEMGISYNIGKSSGDTTTIDRASYSAHFLLKKEKLRLMAEYIAGENNHYTHNIRNKNYSYLGYLFELSYHLNSQIEPSIRFDSYQPDTNKTDNFGFNKYDNITLGVNYYPSKNIALMTNYIIRSESNISNDYTLHNNILFVQLRFLFKAS
ncbi:porin [Carboxylicivirga sp. RSCT41]|uniref:porin n=1 Tax=Carboxylicivirga agarovorans TaxID=3417570 RepID=UPI003D3597C5